MASEHPLHPKYPEFDTEHAADRDTDCNTERNTDRDTNRDTNRDTSCDTDCDTDLESDTTIGDDREEEVIQEAVLAVLVCKERKSQPYHTGLRGRDYVQELLNCGNQRRHFDVLRMSLTAFQALVYWLGVNTELKSSRTQAGALIEEKVMIFLYIISRGASNRDTAERFSHSGRGISE